MFLRNPENRKELLNDPHPDCQWVFDGEGIATRKYDGTCVKIDPYGYWKRREVKKGKPDPDGFVLVQQDEITGKRVGWVKVDQDDPSDKFHMEAYKKGLEFGTYELCGPKVQGNQEKFSSHVLVNHKYAEILNEVPRTFKGLEGYLIGKDMEGIVFHHEDGRMCKIKKRDFGLKR